MLTIYKYVLPFEDEYLLPLPVGAKILNVHSQDDRVCLWALVDMSRDVKPRRFFVRGTGHPIDQNRVGEYIGSAHTHDGAGVWHVFEGKP